MTNNPSKLDIRVNGTMFETLKSFKYFGSIIYDPGHSISYKKFAPGKLRSACTNAQACRVYAVDAWLPTENHAKTLIRRANARLIRVFAGRTCNLLRNTVPGSNDNSSKKFCFQLFHDFFLKLDILLVM